MQYNLGIKRWKEVIGIFETFTLKSLFENSYSHRIETEDGGRNVNFNLP